MVEIKRAQRANAEILALLGRITYTESHGHFIEDKSDLMQYKDDAFSILRTTQEIDDPGSCFYILYVDELPVGYAKLVLNAAHGGAASRNSCELERIYILSDFIPLKLGQAFLDFLEEKARELQFDTMWLTVYSKNARAIRFYKKNDFKEVGTSNFLVNGKDYLNVVFSKQIK